MTNKKYILKPGRHQFVPGSHAAHENDNLSDEEAEWYLKQYPHIAALFETVPDNALKISQPKNSPSFGEGRGEAAACRVSSTETTQSQYPELVKSSNDPDSYRDTEITPQKSVESQTESV